MPHAHSLTPCDDIVDGSIAAYGAALSEKNLSKHNARYRKRRKINIHRFEPLLRCSPSADRSMSPSESTNSGRSSPTKRSTTRSTSVCLDSHRIFINRFKKRPADLEALCEDILKRRPGEISPISKRIATRADASPHQSEAELRQLYGSYLGIRGEDEDIEEPGEPCIKRSPELNWAARCVPNSLEESKAFKDHMKATGEPATPRPDFTYGYSNSAFNEAQLQILPRLLDLYCPTGSKPPWFPFFVQEWKSSAVGGSIEEAEIQVRRSGAAAVNALHKLMHRFGAEDSLASRTATFSLCVDSNFLRIYLHWINEREEKASFEADRIYQGFLTSDTDIFHARSIIFNIIEWAKGPRLQTLKRLFSAHEEDNSSDSRRERRSVKSAAASSAASGITAEEAASTPATATSLATPTRKRPRPYSVDSSAQSLDDEE